MISKIIHQIWIGGECPPSIIKMMQTVKDKHPEYLYNLWGNESLRHFNLEYLIGKKKIFGVYLPTRALEGG